MRNMFKPGLLLVFALIGIACFWKQSEAQTQMQLDQQSGEKLKKSNQVMERAIRKLDGLISPHQKALLAKSQSAWLQFRKEDARFCASRYTGGSIYPMIYKDSEDAETKQRVQELLEIVKQIKQVE